MFLSNILCINVPGQRFSLAIRNDQDSLQKGRVKPYLSLPEYQFSQLSRPALRWSRELGVEFGRARSVCSRLTDLEVDEKVTNGFVALGCNEFAVDLSVYKNSTCLTNQETRTRMCAFSRFPDTSRISSRYAIPGKMNESVRSKARMEVRYHFR